MLTTTIHVQGIQTNSTGSNKNGSRTGGRRSGHQSRRRSGHHHTCTTARTKGSPQTNRVLSLLHLQWTQILKALFPRPTIFPPPNLAETAWSKVPLYQANKLTSRDILREQPSEIPTQTRPLSSRSLHRPRINNNVSEKRRHENSTGGFLAPPRICCSIGLRAARRKLAKRSTYRMALISGSWQPVAHSAGPAPCFPPKIER
jgi:hypothetical protein